MSEVLLQVSLKALIRNNLGQYLFLKRVRPYDGESEPRWDVPGGKLIPGETLFESLSREIFEETHLHMKGEPRIFDVRDVLRVSGKHTVRLTFLVDLEIYEPVLLDPNEHTEYRWALPVDMLKLYHDTYLTFALERAL